MDNNRQKIVAKSEGFFSENKDESRIIRGLLSVDTKDLTGDVALPEEFNLESYKKNPQVLFEHDLAVDENGNKSSIGHCVDIAVVTIKDSGDPVYFNLVDKMGNIIDLFPKAKSNQIGDGTKAIWCAIEITNNLIWKRIKNGELTAFSWQGFCQVDEEGDTKYLKDIDLLEISVVSMPCNRSAFFYVKSIFLDSAEYDEDKVLGFVEEHKFDGYSIYKCENKWAISKSDALSMNKGTKEKLLNFDVILDSETKMEVEQTETNEIQIENKEIEVTTPTVTNVSIEDFENYKREQEKAFNTILSSIKELSSKFSGNTEAKSNDIKVEITEPTKNVEDQKSNETDKLNSEITELKSLLKNLQKNFVIESDRDETLVKKDHRSEDSRKNDVFNEFFGIKE